MLLETIFHVQHLTLLFSRDTTSLYPDLDSRLTRRIRGRLFHEILDSTCLSHLHGSVTYCSFPSDALPSCSPLPNWVWHGRHDQSNTGWTIAHIFVEIVFFPRLFYCTYEGTIHKKGKGEAHFYLMREVEVQDCWTFYQEYWTEDAPAEHGATCKIASSQPSLKWDF